MTVHEHHEHPVDTLEGEHRVIQSVLDAMEREAAAIQAGHPLRKQFWLEVSDFLEHFADGYHHAKEEDLLFPVLAERGIAEEGGPIGCMKHEHVEGRSLRQQIQDAATDGDAGAVVTAAREFVFLLREHIDKEEMVLFRLARQILNAKKEAALEESFARVQREQPSSRYLELATKLCGEAGLSTTT
jgi:hemerythrin-like domain-containing protein